MVPVGYLEGKILQLAFQVGKLEDFGQCWSDIPLLSRLFDARYAQFVSWFLLKLQVTELVRALVHICDVATAAEASKCRSYRGHLRGPDYKNNKAVPQGEALVLFHYMTRSFQDFRERKLSRYAGMYVDDFRERRANATRDHGTAPPDEELFDDLEASLGIDRAAPVCSSAVDARYASKCCE